MSKRTDAESKFNRVTREWNDTRQSYAQALQALEANRDYSDAYKAKQRSELAKAHNETIARLAPLRWTAAQEFAGAVRTDRQAKEQAHKSRLDYSRLPHEEQIIKSRLATAQTLQEVEALGAKVYASGDATEIEAFRVVGPEVIAAKFVNVSGAPTDARARANSFARQLTRDREADVPSELRTAREEEDRLGYFLQSTHDEILRVGPELLGRPLGLWERNPLADAVGDPNEAQVVFRDKSEPMILQSEGA